MLSLQSGVHNSVHGIPLLHRDSTPRMFVEKSLLEGSTILRASYVRTRSPESLARPVIITMCHKKRGSPICGRMALHASSKNANVLHGLLALRVPYTAADVVSRALFCLSYRPAPDFHYHHGRMHSLFPAGGYSIIRCSQMSLK